MDSIGMKILRCWCSNPTGGKLFAINLPLTTKQYKVDNITNFVYYSIIYVKLFTDQSELSALSVGCSWIYPIETLPLVVKQKQ